MGSKAGSTALGVGIVGKQDSGKAASLVCTGADQKSFVLLSIQCLTRGLHESNTALSGLIHTIDLLVKLPLGEESKNKASTQKDNAGQLKQHK